MEIPKPEPAEGRESTGLYRERVSSEHYLDKYLEEIDRLTEGEGVLDLTEVERTTVLEYESGLEERLYEIHSPSVRSVSFDPEFLLTEEGRNFFAEKTGSTDLPQTKEEIIKYLYSNADKLTGMGKDNRKDLEGLAKKFRDEKVAQQLAPQIDENGDMMSVETDMGERLGIVLDTEKLVTKNTLLREFKSQLKAEYRDLDDRGDAAEAKKEIINLYLHRINLMLASISGSVRAVARKAELAGIDSLGEDERALLKIDTKETDSELLSLRSQGKRERDASRYDRFVHGASLGYSDHERPQVDAELAEYAEKIGKRWLEENVIRQVRVETNGIDYEKINAKNISAEARKRIIEEHLAKLGILNTEEDAEDDVEAPPEQKNYKVRIKKGSRSASVGQKYRKLFIPDIDASITTLLATEAGHEVGHVLQGINGSEIPLKLFERIGGGGSTAFSEGGAISVQSKITQALFGYEVASHPHYIRAMSEKQRGGNYLDTVKVFYQSAIEPHQIKYKNGEITKEELRENIDKCLILAVDRSQRLFRGGRRSAQEPVLTSSKDTAYVEQLKIAEALTARGKEKLLLIRGMSLENICTLLKLGFLKMDQIKEPDYEYIKSVWEKEKPKYVLEQN